MSQEIYSGITDQFIYVKMVDATDFATPETGLSGFTVYRSRNGGSATAMTTPTVTEVDATNAPGVYKLLMDEDTTLDAGDVSQNAVYSFAATGAANASVAVVIKRPAVTAGETLTVASGIATANKNLDQPEYTADGRRVWYVDNVNDGTGDNGTQAAPFDTITAATSASGTGDVIIVAKGTYTAQVVPKDGQRIIGAGPALTIVQISTVVTPVLSLSTKNDVYIEGIKFQHTGSWQAINATGCNRCTFKRVHGVGPADGLRMDTSNDCYFEDCRLTSNYDAAVANGANNVFRRCYLETAASTGAGTAAGAFRTSSNSNPVNSVSAILEECTLVVRRTVANTSVACCVETDETSSVVLDNCLFIAESTNATDTGMLAAVISSDTSRCQVKGGTILSVHAGSGAVYDLRQEDTSKLLVDPSSTAYSTAKTNGTITTPIMTAAVAAQTRAELALPPFEYNAAGGLITSAAGGLDLDAALANLDATISSRSDGTGVILAANQSAVEDFGGIDVSGAAVPASGDWNTLAPPTADQNADALLAKAVPVSPTAGTVAELFKFQRTTLASDGVFTEAALADAPAGEGGAATVTEEAAEMIAAKVNASRGTYYPPPALVWVLQRSASGIVVKDGFVQSKGAGETAIRYIDFAALLGRNEAVQSIDSISIAGSTFAITADSDSLVGNLLKFTITGGESAATGTVSFEVTTTAGQVLEGEVEIGVP